MTTPFSALIQLLQETADGFFQAALDVAEQAGLPVTTWRVGDPTRTLFVANSKALENLEAVQVQYARANFLSEAEGDFLRLRATDVYGVDPDDATFATSTITIDNSGGGLYEFDVGGLIVSNSATGKTYVNQAVVSIDPLETDVSISIVAQEEGSGSSSSADEIDTIVSPSAPDLSITSSTAAVGSDAQSDAGIVEECLDTLGALSPAGPPDAYTYVAKNYDLTGVQGVTRAVADGDSADGTVTVYVATTTAALDSGSVAAIQSAIDLYAQPLCTDATVVSGTPQSVNVTAVLTPAKSSFDDADGLMATALDEFFAGIKTNGTVAESALHAVFHDTLGSLGLTKVSLTGFTEVTLTGGAFPVLGTLALT